MEELNRKRELDECEEEIRFKCEMLWDQSELAMSEARIGILENENGSTRSSSKTGILS